jgi:hypothetical protein
MPFAWCEPAVDFGFANDAEGRTGSTRLRQGRRRRAHFPEPRSSRRPSVANSSTMPALMSIAAAMSALPPAASPFLNLACPRPNRD